MTVAESGYVMEWCPTHPKASQGVYFQHRLVMECTLGRFLDKREIVHHRDRDRTNNDPDNLMLGSNHSEHMRLHWQNKGRRDPAIIERVRIAAADPDIVQSSVGVSTTMVRMICDENGIEWVYGGSRGRAMRLTDETVRKALQGRTTAQVAGHFGVSVTTIYGRFSHLLTKRTRSLCLDDSRAEILNLVYKQRVSRCEVARRWGVSKVCVTRSIQRWSKQGATLDGLALPEPPHNRPGPKPGRKARDMAPLSPSHGVDPEGWPQIHQPE